MSKISNFFNKLKIKRLPSEQEKTEEENLIQYDYQTIMRSLKQGGKLEKFFLELDQLYQEADKYYPSEVHGIDHTARVTLIATVLTEIDYLDKHTQKLIITSARYHDIGRVDDEETKEHGKYSKDKLERENLLKDFSKRDKEIIEFAAEQHSLSAKENEEAIEQLPFWKRKKYALVLRYLKDADAMDRVRAANKSSQLDSNRLRTRTAKQLVEFAYDNFWNFNKIISEYQLRNVAKQDLVIQKVCEIVKDDDIDTNWILQNQDIIKNLYARGIITNLVKENVDLIYVVEHKELIEAASQIKEGDFEEFKKKYNITYLSFLEMVSAYQEGTLEELRKEGKLDQLCTYETFQKYGKEQSFRERVKENNISDDELLAKINYNSIEPITKETFNLDYMLYRNLYKNNKEAFDLFTYLGLGKSLESMIGIFEVLELNDLEKVRQSGCKISLSDLIQLSSRFSPEEYREIIDSNKIGKLFEYDQEKDKTNKFQQILDTIEENHLEISKQDLYWNYELYKEVYDSNKEIYAMPEMKKYSIQEIYPALTKMNEAKERLNAQRDTKIDFKPEVLVDLIEFLRKNRKIFFFR